MNTAIIVLATLLLAALLAAEKKKSLAGKLATKPLVSLLFIVAAAIQPHPAAGYARWLMAGLVFCMGGDICLALPQRPMFLAGLVSFLIGHLMYVAAFATITPSGLWLSPWGLVVVGVSIGVFFRLRPHLGKMTGPVIAYIVIISTMLIGALAVLRTSHISGSAGWVIFTGAVLFYLSDLFVARNRFVSAAFVNRLFGLPIYYAGQFLLAFSVGMIG